MTVRIDKWTWAARLYKTRSKATEACSAGHVKLNGSVVKPSHLVKIGDILEVTTQSRFFKYEVIGIGERRGSVEDAAKLFIDHSPAPEPYEPPPIIRDRGAGRPTKRDRRKMMDS